MGAREGPRGRSRTVTRVLLITGARSLADDPAAEAWARAIIAEALAGVDLLIVGDAPGPDAWAVGSTVRYLVGEEWRGRDVECHRYITRGRDAGWVVSPDDDGETTRVARWSRAGDSHPLKRNAAMVRDAVALRDDPLMMADVRCLALLDGRKPAVVKPGEKRPTRGTEHTARLARAAGLTVDAQTWGSR